MAVTKLDIKNAMLRKTRALGNSSRGLKEVCSDLLHQHGVKGKDLKRLCAGTFLSETTIERMATLKEAESGLPYRPNADTCERILKYFGAEIHFDQVDISYKHQNKPKLTD